MSMLHNFSRSSIKKSPEDDCTHMYLKMSQFSSIQGIQGIHFPPFSSHFWVNFGSNRFNSASILLVGLANIFFGSVSAGAAESNPITTSDLPRIRI